MAEQVFPTKGNLINTKKSLALAKVGFELLDRKRNIIVREMMTLIDRASAIQSRIDSTYAQAYLALQRANVAHGICDDIADAVPVENGCRSLPAASWGWKSPSSISIPNRSSCPTAS